MPTYEFRAPDGSIIERIFKISEVPESVELPDGSVATRIISGGAGLLFKGSGFYITDYGKDGKKDQRAATSDTSSTTGTGTSGTTGNAATGGTSPAGTGTTSNAKPASSPTTKAE